jgi:hypothetical protein
MEVDVHCQRCPRSVPPARLQLPFLDPQRLRELRIIASDFLEEAVGVLAVEVDLERSTEREVGRELLLAVASSTLISLTAAISRTQPSGPTRA